MGRRGAGVEVTVYRDGPLPTKPTPRSRITPGQLKTLRGAVKQADVVTRYEPFKVMVGTTNSREDVLVEIRRALALIFSDVEVS